MKVTPPTRSGSGKFSLLTLRARWTAYRSTQAEQRERRERLCDLVAPQLLSFASADSVQLSDGDWARSWYVGEWPGYVSPQLVFDLYTGNGIDADLRLSLYIESQIGQAVARRLANQATGIRAKQWLRASRNLDPSPLDDARLSQLEAERRLLEVAGDPFFEATLTLTLFARSKQKLDERSKALEEKCRAAGLIIRRAHDRQDLGLEAILPLGSGAMRDYRRNLRKLALRNLFPFVGGELVTPNGIDFGIDLQASSPVCFDPFRLTTPHMVIMGTSGAGKSVLMKDLVEQFVLDGARCFVTDIEGEYRALCEDLGGLYLDLSIGSSDTVNVLDVNPDDEDGLAGAFGDFKGWTVCVLGRPLKPAEDVILYNAHAAAFKARGFDERDRASFASVPPLLADVYAAIETLPRELAPDDDARHELLAALYRYVKGDLSRAFNRQTTFSHRSVPLVVFGLSKVPTELKRVRMRQLQHYVWSQHVDKSKRTVEFLDEAWHFLSNPETAKDLADRIVRLRKYGGAVVMATQQVDDYLKNDEARRAISQASVRIIMKQRDESVNTVGDLYGLTDQERRTVRTLRHGEYLMLSGGFRSLIAKVVPAERLALYDTRADAQPAHAQVAQDTAGGRR